MLSLFFGIKASLYQQLLKVTLGTSMCFVVILCMVPTYIQVLVFQRVFFSVCVCASLGLSKDYTWEVPHPWQSKMDIRKNFPPQTQIPTKANDSVQASFPDLIYRLFNSRTVCFQKTMLTMLIKLLQKGEIP